MERMNPLLETKSLTDVNSSAHRIEESKAFLVEFRENPLFGGGMGSSIRFDSPIFGRVERSNWHDTFPMLLG